MIPEYLVQVVMAVIDLDLFSGANGKEIVSTISRQIDSSSKLSGSSLFPAKPSTTRNEKIVNI